MNTEAFLKTLDESIAFWRDTQNDPYQISVAVMVALTEVRKAVVEANKADLTMVRDV